MQTPSRKPSTAETNGIDWLAIEKTLVIQVALLLAALGAVIQYVNWSSGLAQAEFARAVRPMLLDPASPDKRARVLGTKVSGTEIVLA